MPTQTEKGLAFRALHERARRIPHSQSLGRWHRAPAGAFGLRGPCHDQRRLRLRSRATRQLAYRDQTIAHVSVSPPQQICRSAAIWKTASRDAPEEVAETIRSPPRRGLPADPSRTWPGNRTIRSMRRRTPPSGSAQPRRPRATLPFAFTLTARAENYLVGRARSRRYHRAPASLPGGGRRCPLRPRTPG